MFKLLASKSNSISTHNIRPLAFNLTRSTKSTLSNNIFKRRFNSQSKPNYNFTENPIVFNKINEQYVIRGKERIVGLWLLTVSASIFSIIVLGGYTRMSKSGLSMTKWHPHRVMPPRNKEEWEKEFEEYKTYPEYYRVNQQLGMDLEGFKTIYYVEWAHRIVGRSIGLIFFGPMAYFLKKGYIQPKLKRSLVLLFALGGLQGAIGWWMVKSGLVDKDKTQEIDKSPRVSPYRLLIHGGFAYLLYGICFWQALHLLRRPQESVINIKNMADHNILRKVLGRFAHSPIFPLTLLFGFFTAGIGARYACNTYPFVGPNWFLTRNHFQSDIPWWQNFTENKLVVQVTHRTLALLFVGISLKSLSSMLKLPGLTKQSRFSINLVITAMLLQLVIGMYAVWYPQPTEFAVLHQIGALTLVSALIFALHTCRRVDPRHIRNLLGKLKVEDPNQYKIMMEQMSKNMGKREYDAAKKIFDETIKPK